MDPASFAASAPSLKELQQKYVQKVAPAIKRVAAGRLTPSEMVACLEQGAKGSGFGRFVLAHNYWMIPGRGDAGCFYIVRLHRDFNQTSGYRPDIQKFAKFSSVEAAVDAWCKQRRK